MEFLIIRWGHCLNSKKDYVMNFIFNILPESEWHLVERNEKYLSIRSFTDKMKREAYERQKGICPKCKEHFEIEEMEADHITHWHEGGKTTAENCQMLCKHYNRIKSRK